jgi:hypothetical protein
VIFDLNGAQIEVAWYAALDICDRPARADHRQLADQFVPPTKVRI